MALRCGNVILGALVLGIIVLIAAFAPAPAHADASLAREQVTAFLGAEQGRVQATTFLNAAAEGAGTVKPGQVTFPQVAKVHYVHAQADQALANDLTDLGTFEWRAVVSVDGAVRGTVIVWNDGGAVAVGGYDPDVDEAAAVAATPDDRDAVLIVDQWVGERYLVQDGVMSAVNDKARERLAEPAALAQAARTVVKARGGDPDKAVIVSQGDGDTMVYGAPGSADSAAGRGGFAESVPWVVGVAIVVVAVAGVGVIVVRARRGAAR